MSEPWSEKDLPFGERMTAATRSAARRPGRRVKSVIWLVALAAAVWLLAGCAGVQRECPLAAGLERERGAAVVWCQR